MKLVIFGLAVSSSWGNGHATLWRGLGRALGSRGHRVVFFERDQSFYAAHRDLERVPGMELVLYPDWPAAAARGAAELADADLGMVTSFCPDGRAASALVLSSPARSCFYDLDSPVTLQARASGQEVPYLPREGLGAFDLVLSYTGGLALERLCQELGARRALPLYGSVDPDVHRPVEGQRGHALSYLGTYAPDRQAALEALLLEPARRAPRRRFLIGGAQYPPELAGRLPDNVALIPHLPPDRHADFYASAPLTLNVTRAAMAALGFCPSARFFEAAACGVPVLSDRWPGLEHFFEPEREVLLAGSSEEALAALERPDQELRRLGGRARARVLAEHTALHRARQLEGYL